MIYTHTVVLAQLQLGRNPVLFNQKNQISIWSIITYQQRSMLCLCQCWHRWDILVAYWLLTEPSFSSCVCRKPAMHGCKRFTWAVMSNTVSRKQPASTQRREQWKKQKWDPWVWHNMVKLWVNTAVLCLHLPVSLTLTVNFQEIKT